MHTLAVLGLLASAAVFGQTAANAPAFEVASIKIDTSSDEPSGGFRNGRVTIHNQSLRSLIGAAYHVPNDSILGPDWLDAVHFDVAAKTDAGASQDDARLMLQTLLAERLKLKVHPEKKMVEVYALTVAKNGPKLSQSKADSPAAPGCPDFHPLTCRKVNLSALEVVLPRLAGRQLDLPVKNLTGLTGLYDFQLSLEPDVSGHRPSVFEAFEQLGLKLQAVKRPLDAFIVDHVEKVPIEN